LHLVRRAGDSAGSDSRQRKSPDSCVFRRFAGNEWGVGVKATRTAEFEEYLKRELDKCGSVTTFVLMDFADTGASLYKLKKDVKELRPLATVKTAVNRKIRKVRIRRKLDEVMETELGPTASNDDDEGDVDLGGF
jgi:hypothetical protein